VGLLTVSPVPPVLRSGVVDIYSPVNTLSIGGHWICNPSGFLVRLPFRFLCAFFSAAKLSGLGLGSGFAALAWARRCMLGLAVDARV
jgi:hypothetical protein